MIVQMFAVFDLKARNFGQPFFTLTPEVALRSFQTTVNDPSSMLNKYPEDFQLFRLGTFNDENAEFVTIMPPENYGLAATFKAVQLQPAKGE